MTLDLTPLFHASVGFEHLTRMFEEITGKSHGNSYPPYNIYKIDKNKYRISIALAGFKNNEVEITLKENILKVISKGAKEKLVQEYLYKGIANRAFEKKFQLAENIKIKNAFFENGLLNIDLTKIPSATSKSIKIEIE